MPADVNKGMYNIINLGLKKKPCPIDIYRAHLNGCTQPYRVQSSWNYQGVAVAQDMLNNLNGFPHVLTLKQLFDWTVWFLKLQLTTAAGFMGHEMDSLIYIGHHLRYWRVVRAGAMKKGRQDVVALCNLIILVLLVHQATDSMPRPIKGFSTAQQVLRKGAGFFEAEASLTPFQSKFPLLAGLIGQRSFGREVRFDQGYWSGPICEALGMMPAGEDTVALRAAGYDASWGLNTVQISTLKGVVNGSVPDLTTAIGWIRTVKTNVEKKTEWRTGGKQTWIEHLPGGSTAGLNYRGVVAGTGVQRVLSACNGERSSSSGDTDVGPSTTVLSQAAGIVRCMRDDLPPVVIVDGQPVHHTAQCQVIGGTLLARVSWGPLGHRIGTKIISLTDGDDMAFEEDETTQPPLDPRIQKINSKNIFEKIWDWIRSL